MKKIQLKTSIFPYGLGILNKALCPLAVYYKRFIEIDIFLLYIS